MVKVKLSNYWRQLITVFVMAILFAVGLGFILKNWWSVIIIPVFLAFYAKDINRTFYMLTDKRKNQFVTGTFVFCGDIDKIKRSAERSSGIKEGRLSSARMTMNTYDFKEVHKENSEPIKMTLYIPDSVNYKLILSRILKNPDHKFTITYGLKSGVITEMRS